MNIFKMVHNESIEYLETVCFLRIQSWDGTQSLKKIPRVNRLTKKQNQIAFLNAQKFEGCAKDKFDAVTRNPYSIKTIQPWLSSLAIEAKFTIIQLLICCRLLTLLILYINKSFSTAAAFRKYI